MPNHLQFTNPDEVRYDNETVERAAKRALRMQAEQERAQSGYTLEQAEAVGTELGVDRALVRKALALEADVQARRTRKWARTRLAAGRATLVLVVSGLLLISGWVMVHTPRARTPLPAVTRPVIESELSNGSFEQRATVGSIGPLPAERPLGWITEGVVMLERGGSAADGRCSIRLGARGRISQTIRTKVGEGYRLRLSTRAVGPGPHLFELGAETPEGLRQFVPVRVASGQEWQTVEYSFASFDGAITILCETDPSRGPGDVLIDNIQIAPSSNVHAQISGRDVGSPAR
jgi:hypothetical protein